ncbi:MAG: serine protease [bacterium]|nr:serine protease [bacterium]
MAARPNKGAIAVLVLALIGVLWLLLPEGAERTLDYSVEIQIESEKGPFFGSGTAIGHTRTRSGHSIITHSTVLTAAHVVKDAKQGILTVVWGDFEIPGRIVPGSIDEERDLALVEVDSTLPIAPLFFGGTRSGEPAIAVGNQFGHGLIMSDGRVGPEVVIETGEQSFENFEVSAPSYKGSSGGGVFAWRYGRLGLVGVIQGLPSQPVAVGSIFGIPIFKHVAVTTLTYARPMEVVREYLVEYGFPKYRSRTSGPRRIAADLSVPYARRARARSFSPR